MYSYIYFSLKVYTLTTVRNQNYPISSFAPIRLSSMGRSTIWKEAKIDINSNSLSFYSSRTIIQLDELERQELNTEVDIVVYILGKYIIWGLPRNPDKQNPKRVIIPTDWPALITILAGFRVSGFWLLGF